MLILFLQFTVIGFVCSMIGHVVSNILLYEEVLSWYGRLLEKLPTWLAKPLGACVLCFSGQLALWSSLVYAIHFGGGWFIPYSICLAIFLGGKYK